MDGYYAFMLVATALVLMMTVPALALFYGGMTRAKSTLNMMMLSFVAFGIAAIVMVLWGWSEGGYINGDADGYTATVGKGYDNGKLIASPFTLFSLHHVGWDQFIFVMFQMTFAAITVALISGSIADRVKIGAWAVFVPIWLTVCYFPIAHNVWGGGWLAHQLAKGSTIPEDYAGGTVVHINAGVAGLVLALIIGKRVGWPKNVGRPHNVTLTMIGAGLLWFGWYGFNVGSIVFSAGDGGKKDTAQFMTETGVTFLNTTIATAAAMLAWLLTERIVHGKATSLGAASGIVAGLVAITPSCGAVTLVGAIVVGVVAGVLCALAIGLKYKLNMDDSLDVVGVHLVGGLVGTLLIGLVGSHNAPGAQDGLFYGGKFALLGDQALAALFTVVWTGVLTTVIALAIKYTIGWRVSEDAEVAGIDDDQHGESAYDIAPGTGVLA